MSDAEEWYVESSAFVGRIYDLRFRTSHVFGSISMGGIVLCLWEVESGPELNRVPEHVKRRPWHASGKASSFHDWDLIKTIDAKICTRISLQQHITEHAISIAS